jgi:enoyl-[acyl-carrier protein] reductase I
MKAIDPGKGEKLVEYTAERSPLRRAIKPEEVADSTVFLCSPLASAITGHILYVDCGFNVMGG